MLGGAQTQRPPCSGGKKVHRESGAVALAVALQTSSLLHCIGVISLPGLRGSTGWPRRAFLALMSEDTMTSTI